MNKLLQTAANPPILLIRIAVGCIFLTEGIQKFLFPAELGAGRFAKIGIPYPDFFGPFVGTFEILCGSMVLIGCFTRLFSIPLIIIMLVAITITKLVNIPVDGFWETAHGARTDFSMLLSSLFLLISGSGKWSVDNSILKSRQTNDSYTSFDQKKA
ncbi:DoxX family protein [Rhodocytophaga rosea]|uniref:DoxX family protein n=1 Tax=Rhodocytophaga rosea TaxID=2704465 RepID=A0A6C0GLY3_9BACT|nr:DoxX family protein [Rhodocytophaga rosea]QHT69046.1 DoxX family protein [Rhodocytophaga rosea]